MSSKKRKPDDDVDGIARDGEDWGSPRTIINASRKRVADPVADKYKNDVMSLRQQALEALNEQYQAALIDCQASLNQSQTGPESDTTTIGQEEEFSDRVYWLTAHYETQLRRIDDIYPIKDAGVLRQVMGMGSEDTNSIGLMKKADAEKEHFYPPTVVRNLPRHDVLSVTCGGQTSAALTVDGRVYTWGVNDDAALGRPVRENEEHLIKRMDAPTTTDLEIPNGYMSNVIQVRMGDSHTLLLTIDGEVYCAGQYKEADATYYRDISSAQSKAYKDFKSKSKEEQKIIKEMSEEIVVNRKGWGQYVPTGLHGANLAPTRVENLPRKVMWIECGEAFNVAQLNDGTLYTWGIGISGELARSRGMGAQVTKEMEYKPAVKGDPERRKPPIGDLYDAMRDREGKLQLITLYRTYELGKSPELGRSFMGEYRDKVVLDEEGKPKMDPTTGKPKTKQVFVVDDNKMRRTFLTPGPVEWAGKPQKREVLQFACGSMHLIVVARDFGVFSPRVYSSGANNYGQLGHGDMFERHELTPILALDNKRISKAAGGNYHSLAMAMDGSCVFAWGAADKGQLGLCETAPEDGHLEANPKEVPFPEETMGASRIIDIACGETTSFARTSKGTIYSWGFNETGATGHPSFDGIDVYLPKLVELNNTIVDGVSGGGHHSLFLVKRYRGA